MKEIRGNGKHATYFRVGRYTELATAFDFVVCGRIGRKWWDARCRLAQPRALIRRRRGIREIFDFREITRGMLI